MNMKEIMTEMSNKKASDVFIVAGLPITYRKNNKIEDYGDTNLTPDDTKIFITEIYHMANDRNIGKLTENGDDDFSFAIPGVARFRVSAYMQRGSMAAVLRVIAFELPDYQSLNIPKDIIELSDNSSGMILVTGPADSGKSTTLACMIDKIGRASCRERV